MSSSGSLGEPNIDTVKRRAQHAFQIGALCEAAPEQFVRDESLHGIVCLEESVRGSGVHHAVLVRIRQLAFVPAFEETEEQRGKHGGRVRIGLARENVPFEGLPARIAWLGHGARTELALAVNALVAKGELAAPIAFSRDHLDAAGMAHPNIMTERMKDESDAIADWPLLDAMALCSSMADLVAIHSGGAGYAGYMTSAGVTLIADGSDAAAKRLARALTNDTSLGILRYADAGYEEALDEAARKGVRGVALGP